MREDKFVDMLEDSSVPNCDKYGKEKWDISKKLSNWTVVCWSQQHLAKSLIYRKSASRLQDSAGLSFLS